ncbi:hypothetical protein SY89_02068 [Halolamina pelagica]|uniref:Uncharacterized protein n=1 Tax=Halolamina pelagica TaxID=699431 RepID=A0A0P7GQ89_9EURY|nr:hypothetical protein SY89_02068 [Halolamina pelagica]
MLITGNTMCTMVVTANWSRLAMTGSTIDGAPTFGLTDAGSQ